MKLSILGTEYELIVATDEDQPYLKNCDGYCDTSVKKLYVKDFSFAKDDPSSLQDLESYTKKVARHEVVHAFLYESGLSVNSDWASNEELVDWIAMQLHKLYKVAEQLDKTVLMPKE